MKFYLYFILKFVSFIFFKMVIFLTGFLQILQLFLTFMRQITYVGVNVGHFHLQLHKIANFNREAKKKNNAYGLKTRSIQCIYWNYWQDLLTHHALLIRNCHRCEIWIVATGRLRRNLFQREGRMQRMYTEHSYTKHISAVYWILGCVFQV